MRKILVTCEERSNYMRGEQQLQVKKAMTPTHKEQQHMKRTTTRCEDSSNYTQGEQQL